MSNIGSLCSCLLFGCDVVAVHTSLLRDERQKQIGQIWMNVIGIDYGTIGTSHGVC